MPKRLAFMLSFTDIVFLLYWSASALNLMGWIHIPPEWMYSDYDKPHIIAWNWSFLPIDLAFSITGLSAVAAARRGLAIWRPLALLSLAFTMAAGGTAIAYWTLMCEFNLWWFMPNLELVLWPIPFLPGLIRDLSKSG